MQRSTIETLEKALGTALFQRHARGYTLTDAGRDMLDVANRADEMFADLEGRTKNRKGQLSGELTISALGGLAPMVVPALRAFHDAHPAIQIEFVVESRLAKLEYGEAQVAFRAGPKPEEPDYVVLPFRQIRFGLYCSQDYVRRHGHPREKRFDQHLFVGIVSRPTAHPYSEWMRANVPQTALSLETTNLEVKFEAVRAGMGLGFLAEHEAEGHPDLVEILPPDDKWTANIWIVTHVDLHRTAKVQAFLHFVRN